MLKKLTLAVVNGVPHAPAMEGPRKDAHFTTMANFDNGP
jgi:hypothetical protein